MDGVIALERVSLDDWSISTSTGTGGGSLLLVIFLVDIDLPNVMGRVIHDNHS